jgi:hypothetical protein
MGLFSKRNPDADLVTKFVNGQATNTSGVTKAGRRLAPTGKWVCTRCEATWTASGVVPVQWWIPANNTLSSKTYREMKESELPPWHCRQGLCGSYAYTIPIP